MGLQGSLGYLSILFAGPGDFRGLLGPPSHVYEGPSVFGVSLALKLMRGSVVSATLLWSPVRIHGVSGSGLRDP